MKVIFVFLLSLSALATESDSNHQHEFHQNLLDILDQHFQNNPQEYREEQTFKVDLKSDLKKFLQNKCFKEPIDVLDYYSNLQTDEDISPEELDLETIRSLEEFPVTSFQEVQRDSGSIECVEYKNGLWERIVPMYQCQSLP